MDALLVLVTEGIASLTRRKRPRSRHCANTGIWLCSRYSTPNPSHITTTMRCGGRWAKAGAERSTAPEARKSRRSIDKLAIRTHYAGDNNFESLVLDVFPQVLGTGFRPIHVAHRIRRHAFRHTGGFCLRPQSRDKHFDDSIFGAADSNPLLHAGVHLFI